jgi:very-short-patch-repair endonuclease
MSSYEECVAKILKKYKLSFFREKTFCDLKKGKYRFDFYLPDFFGAPAIIEVDGEQHFKPIYGRQEFLKG